ncbi:MAG TPA: glutathionylspermidine synthase family protein [Kofleriaceae bacterium]|nr:glutathionylspermidine synthase family protein [Kofleriaceae bacterium]
MRRCAIAQRPDWRARVERSGLVFHTAQETGVYWGEGTYYEFTSAEADAIEAATRELHARCLDAVRHVIERRRYAELGLGELAHQLCEQSWRDQPPSLYGRFDFALGDGVPKMLEYNADTPTSLLEAGVIQWQWRAEVLPDADQFTLVHEKLIATWRQLAPRLGELVHFACVEDLEDEMTIGYLRDTAEQAGLRTCSLAMEDVGWNRARGELVDLEGRAIRALFKLYPWEGVLGDRLAAVVPTAPVLWIEPAWKMILSNKAILPILWELFPGHPNLLPSSREPLADPAGVVRKPLLGREGSNVTIAAPGVDVATAGPYSETGYVYQRYAELGCHDGMRPVVGSWVIGGEPAGVGIRETDGYVTSNTARFVPHIIA